jgi:hypothetical protein
MKSLLEFSLNRTVHAGVVPLWQPRQQGGWCVRDRREAMAICVSFWLKKRIAAGRSRPAELQQTSQKQRLVKTHPIR